MRPHNSWIGVDFDGTLATYESGMAPLLGAPIPLMIDRVKNWLAMGIEVRIVTARASHPSFDSSECLAIEAWCKQHIGVALPIQCHKDYDMIELWDDRCVQVESNTGRIVGGGRSRVGRHDADAEAGC